MNQQRKRRRQAQGKKGKSRILAMETPDQLIDDRKRGSAGHAKVDGHAGLDECANRLA